MSDAPLQSPPARPSRRPLVFAIVMLAAALALAADTVRTALRPDASALPPVPDFVSDAVEVTTRQNSASGTYATGARPGDRTITLFADGRVAFAEIGSTNPELNHSDTYRLARDGRKFQFVTAASGTIDIVNIDNLLYWGDAYRRTE